MLFLHDYSCGVNLKLFVCIVIKETQVLHCINNALFMFQSPSCVVAIKRITKKNLAKSQNLLGKEIKILKVSRFFIAQKPQLLIMTCIFDLIAQICCC
jgi:hypothetical protein